MKQVILLEPHEVRRLEKGKQLEITTPGGTLMLGFDRNGYEVSDDGEKLSFTCNKCNKAFKKARGLKVHIVKKHGGK